MVFELWPLGLCSPVRMGILCARPGLLELKIELHEHAARLQGVIAAPNQFERAPSPYGLDRGDDRAAVVAGLPTEGALRQVLPLTQPAQVAATVPGELVLTFVEGHNLFSKRCA